MASGAALAAAARFPEAPESVTAMRIGIMTPWWCPENYGQLWQSFALQHYLREQGHEPFVIRYTAHVATGTRIRKLLKHPAGIAASLGGRLRRTASPRRKAWAARDFAAFRARHIAATSEIYRRASQLTTAELDCDLYLVGSDQVWNLLALDREARPWFLDFGRPEAKRIAYAASFGAAAVSADYLEFARPLLGKLDAIGVREASGVEICARAGRRDAVHVLDPTLLLPRATYHEICCREQAAPGVVPACAFLYFLKAKVDVPWAAVLRVAAEYDAVPVMTAVYDTSPFPFQEFCDPTPSQWLRALAEARLVFTNSFHGTAFSVLMRKPFVVFLREGGGAAMNDRLLSLLSSLGLQSRIYDGDADSLAAQMRSPIDWDAVEQKLSLLRRRSFAFLRACGLCADTTAAAN
jgi:hypothetical protein